MQEYKLPSRGMLIVEGLIEDSPEILDYHASLVSIGFKGCPQLATDLCRDSLVSLTADVNFFQFRSVVILLVWILTLGMVNGLLMWIRTYLCSFQHSWMWIRMVLLVELVSSKIGVDSG